MENINIYAFYNNKGGVGKTTLCTNIAALYAEKNPEKQVLIIDMCPQANASQFCLGGGQVGFDNNKKLQSDYATRKNIVGLIDWLLKGNSGFSKPNTTYGISASSYNSNLSNNLYLIAGDSFLESLSLAINYSVLSPANLVAWKEYMTAIKRLCVNEFAENNYESLTVFIDCNPSFSIYTQMALVSSDWIIIPMMADFSSAEGVKSIFTMLYGVYPSAALAKYAQNVLTFSKQVERFKLQLPKIYEVVFNNYTANLGVAKAFESVKNELISTCFNFYQKHPTLFASAEEQPKTPDKWSAIYLSDVKDFHTAGKVSSSLGIPIHKLPDHSKYEMPDGATVTMPARNYEQALDEVVDLVNKIP